MKYKQVERKETKVDDQAIRKNEKFKLAEAFLLQLIKTKPKKIEILKEIAKVIKSNFSV